MDKKVFLNLSECYAMGDTLCSTPTVRKLYESYGKKIYVVTYFPELFDNNPYVENTYRPNTINIDHLRENFIVHTTFDILGNKTERNVEYKHARIDIRQYHAISLGFMLLPDEMECDYYPKEYEPIDDLPERYVLIHPVQTWPNRTWSSTNWMKLTQKLNENGILTFVLPLNFTNCLYYNKLRYKSLYFQVPYYYHQLSYCILSYSLMLHLFFY